MKKNILSLVALCFALGLGAQNKKLIVGNWTADKMYMEGRLLFSRTQKAEVFASYKKLAFSDTTELSIIDSLALVETIKEAEVAFGKLVITFDAKGNHTSISYDAKTKKNHVAKGTYKLDKDDDKVLLIKMARGDRFDPSTIVELTATTLTITEPADNEEDEPMILSFVRQPVAFKKPKK